MHILPYALSEIEYSLNAKLPIVVSMVQILVAPGICYRARVILDISAEVLDTSQVVARYRAYPFFREMVFQPPDTLTRAMSDSLDAYCSRRDTIKVSSGVFYFKL